MKQLSGLDSSMLYMETPTVHMHISGLSIYDPSTAPGGRVRFKEIIENVGARLGDIPTMRKRLVNVPFHLDHPYWVDDGNFDPEFHIRHLALPKPGDWRQLCILISRLNSKPLDRAKPLWELYVIEGLDNVEGVPEGCYAIFQKTHHAAVDGTSSMEMSVAMHDMSPDYARPTVSGHDRERLPGTPRLLFNAAFNNVKKPFHFLGVLKNTVPDFARTAAGLTTGNLHRVKDIPRTRFNGTVTPHRVFDAVNVPLDGVRKIKNAIPGATVNDVAIAIVGGSLRKYLAAKGELPDASLAALAPINVRSDKEEAGGNIVSGMIVRLSSDVEHPMERLRTVHESTVDAKELSDAIGAKAMTDYSQFVPSLLTEQAARLASRWGLVNHVSPFYNCVVTNVPGPQVPLYSTGAQMVASYGSAQPVDGLGLIHVISSYCGQFTISITADRGMMPDPAFYRECVEESYGELLNAAGKIATSPTSANSLRKKPGRAKSAKKKPASKRPAKKK